MMLYIEMWINPLSLPVRLKSAPQYRRDHHCRQSSKSESPLCYCGCCLCTCQDVLLYTEVMMFQILQSSKTEEKNLERVRIRQTGIFLEDFQRLSPSLELCSFLDSSSDKRSGQFIDNTDLYYIPTIFLKFYFVSTQHNMYYWERMKDFFLF